MSRIDEKDWKWFGHAGHFICGSHCRFHLCTLIGGYVISTVGEYVPDSSVREILANCRGIKLEGRGDYREADWMKKVGFEEIGCGRLYETYVFKASGKVCTLKDCNCGLPEIVACEIDGIGCNTAGEAAANHMAMCQKWAEPPVEVE